MMNKQSLKQPSLLFCIIFLMYSVTGSAQVYNIKAGKWSDAGTWLNNHIPVAADDVVLHFDVIVDETCYCRSLATNGHNVTVNAGANITVLFATGTQDSVFDQLVVIDTTLVPGKDTITTMRYNYDSQKRLSRIDYYDNDPSGFYVEFDTVFFGYNGSNALPSWVSEGGSFKFYHSAYNERGQVIRDSVPDVWDANNYELALYRYSGDTIFKETTGLYYGSVMYHYLDTGIQKKLGGNVIFEKYDLSENSRSAVYDNHPNPMYLGKNLGLDIPFVIGDSLTRICQQQNNITEIRVEPFYPEDTHSHYLYQYVYKANGYPLYFRSYNVSPGWPGAAYIGTGYFKYRRL